MNTDNLLFGLVVVLLIMVVIETCTYSENRRDNFKSGWWKERGFWMPMHWLRPRLWYTAPKSYGNMYGEELLTCMDMCAGRTDRQDCLKYCKRMYPYMMGFDGPPHYGISALDPSQSGNPDLDIGKKEYKPV